MDKEYWTKHDYCRLNRIQHHLIILGIILMGLAFLIALIDGNDKNDCPQGFKCEKIDTSLCYNLKEVRTSKNIIMEENSREFKVIYNEPENRTFLNNGTEITRCEE